MPENRSKRYVAMNKINIFLQYEKMNKNIYWKHTMKIIMKNQQFFMHPIFQMISLPDL